MAKGDIPHTEATLAEHAEVIRKRCSRVISDVYEIGRRLSEARKICSYGRWLAWLDREFGWSDRTALNYIRVFEVAHTENFSDLSLPVSGRNLLARPSTPQETRTELIARAKSERLSVADIQSSIKAAVEAATTTKVADTEIADTEEVTDTGEVADKWQPDDEGYATAMLEESAHEACRQTVAVLRRCDDGDEFGHLDKHQVREALQSMQACREILQAVDATFGGDELEKTDADIARARMN